MKKILFLVLSSFGFAACQKHTTNIDDYFTAQQKDTLLANVITYIYTPAPHANNTTKYQPQFRSFYTKMLPAFAFQRYYEANDGWNYYFLIRPVGDGSIYKRGILGRFKFKAPVGDATDAQTLMPQAFEELVATPHLKEEEVQERGTFLFQELIKDGNLDKYLSMKHYIEWPDASLRYDKHTHTWQYTHKSLSPLP